MVKWVLIQDGKRDTCLLEAVTPCRLKCSFIFDTHLIVETHFLFSVFAFMISTSILKLNFDIYIMSNYQALIPLETAISFWSKNIPFWLHIWLLHSFLWVSGRRNCLSLAVFMDKMLKNVHALPFHQRIMCLCGFSVRHNHSQQFLDFQINSLHKEVAAWNCTHNVV